MDLNEYDQNQEPALSKPTLEGDSIQDVGDVSEKVDGLPDASTGWSDDASLEQRGSPSDNLLPEDGPLNSPEMLGVQDTPELSSSQSFDVAAEQSENGKALFAEGGYDLGPDAVTVEGKMGLIETEGVGSNGAIEVEAFTAEAELRAGTNAFSARGEASLVEQRGSVFVGDDSSNPAFELGGEVKLLNAEAEIDCLGDGLRPGFDGERYGYYAKAEGSASIASGEAFFETNIDLPWSDNTISLRIGGTADAGVGAGAEGGLFYNVEEDRAHLSAGAAFGVGGFLDISYGSPYQDRQR